LEHPGEGREEGKEELLESLLTREKRREGSKEDHTEGKVLKEKGTRKNGEGCAEKKRFNT